MSDRFSENNARLWNIFALLLCIAVFLVWVGLLGFKYYNFGYIDWDLAFFAQAMGQLLHGSQYATVLGVKLLGNHANLIAFLFLPVYCLFHHPFTLVVLKVLSLCSGGYVLYLLSKEKLTPLWAFLIVVLYFLYIPNVFGMMYEFDFESLSPFFLFLLYYFHAKNRYRAFIVVSILVILIKENMPLIIMAFGIYGFWTKPPNGRWRWCIIPILMGLVSFLILAFLVVPYFSLGITHGHPYIGSYTHLTSSSGDILKTLLRADTINWLKDVFGTLLLMPLLSLPTLFLASPLFAQHLLSSVHTQHTVTYAYVLPLAPFIFLALVESFAFLRSRLKKISCWMVFLLIFIFQSVQFVSYSPMLQARFLSLDRLYLSPYKWNLVGSIPAEAPVVASFEFLAPLSQQSHLYALQNFVSKVSRPLPENVRYALVNFMDPWLVLDFLKKPESIHQQLSKFFSSYHWRVSKSFETFFLLERTAISKENFSQSVQKLRTPFPDEESGGSNILSDGNIALTSLKLSEIKDRILPVVFYWHCLKEKKQHYLIGLSIIGEDGKLIYNSESLIAFPFYPTWFWESTDYIRQSYRYLLPPLKPGIYQLSLDLQLINYFNGTFFLINTVDKSSLGRLVIKGPGL
jgi:uncharacterized membrane protein